jgi:polysaccharide biosynthesis protein PslH
LSRSTALGDAAIPRPDGAWRLLFLTHCPPREDATHGGGRLIAQLLARLAERHRVGVVYLRDLGEPPIDEGLRQRCELTREVRRVDAPRPLLGRVGHRLRVSVSPLRGLPGWAAHLPRDRFAVAANAVIRDWEPDLIQLEFSVMGRYLADLAECRAPRVLNLHMPGSDTIAGDVGRRPWWTRLHHHVERQAWARFERRILRQVTAVVTFTERDRQAVADCVPGVRVECITPGLTIPAAPADPAGRDPARLLFVGHFQHPPNLDAAEWLVQTILPRVRSRFPDVALWLVGGGLPRAFRRLSGQGVVVAGEVPTITPHLEKAAIVVAPIRQGGGIRVKVLEALGAGKPIVATRLAVEGIPVTPGEEVLLAECAEEFADAIGALLADSERRIALGHRARSWAEIHLRWDRSIDAYEALYADLIDSTRKYPD